MNGYIENELSVFFLSTCMIASLMISSTKSNRTKRVLIFMVYINCFDIWKCMECTVHFMETRIANQTKNKSKESTNTPVVGSYE